MCERPPRENNERTRLMITIVITGILIIQINHNNYRNNGNTNEIA